MAQSVEQRTFNPLVDGLARLDPPVSGVNYSSKLFNLKLMLGSTQQVVEQTSVIKTLPKSRSCPA